MKIMNNKKAYPSQELDFNGNLNLGMDLRDYFAAKAMQSMLNAFYNDEAKESPDEILKKMKLISKNAYWFADKMINERDKK